MEVLVWRQLSHGRQWCYFWTTRAHTCTCRSRHLPWPLHIHSPLALCGLPQQLPVSSPPGWAQPMNTPKDMERREDSELKLPRFPPPNLLRLAVPVPLKAVDSRFRNHSYPRNWVASPEEGTVPCDSPRPTPVVVPWKHILSKTPLPI